MKYLFMVVLVFPILISASGMHTKTFSNGFQEDPYRPFAEIMPEIVGGMDKINKKIVYPDIAKKSGIEGKVYILVYVNEKGGVDDVKLVKGIGAGCDDAAMNAFKTANFTPGKDKGTPVKVKLTLPVTFKLK
jgi:protein TonB